MTTGAVVECSAALFLGLACCLATEEFEAVGGKRGAVEEAGTLTGGIAVGADAGGGGGGGCGREEAMRERKWHLSWIICCC